MTHRAASADDLANLERFVRFQDDVLSPDERASFAGELAGDPRLRGRFIDHLVESALIHERLRQHAYLAPTAPTARAWWSMLTSRAAAVVAGALLGTCCASIVLAYTLPIDRSATISILHEGFENAPPVRAVGMPSAAGIWSGDYAEVVTQCDGVRPAGGGRMLRFLRGDHEGRHIPESHSSDMFRLIDVRALEGRLRDGTAIAQLGASFNSAASTPDDPFFCTLTIFALAADFVHGGRPLADASVSRNALAHSASSRVRLDREPATWQRATNELRIPPGTGYLLVRTGVSNASDVPDHRTDAFGGQFVDDVRVVIGHRREINAP